MMCLKYGIIILIIIIILLGQILLSSISNITHTVVIITHYNFMGYVIIPKPTCSSREGINSHCRHFELLIFRRFGSICRRYDCRSYVAVHVVAFSTCRWRSTIYPCRSDCRRFDGDQLNTRFLRSFFFFFPPIQNLLGRTEIGMHERKE